VAGFLATRAFWPPPVRELTTFTDAQLDVPGNPRVVLTPGHTVGHCALHFPDRDTVLAGDAIVMLDPYTGARGPRIVAGAATSDSSWALRSLDDLAAVEAGTVLTGHGEPWRGGCAEAVRLARAAGAS
jgi:glyoxylase-like metal-dependent hydrolase (beta-lactamase superfamily II)